MRSASQSGATEQELASVTFGVNIHPPPPETSGFPVRITITQGAFKAPKLSRIRIFQGEGPKIYITKNTPVRVEKHSCKVTYSSFYLFYLGLAGLCHSINCLMSSGKFSVMCSNTASAPLSSHFLSGTLV